MRRSVLAGLVLLLSLFLVSSSTALAAKKKKNERRGGAVEQAWPKDGQDPPPDNPLAQWLAKQVGPVPVKKTKGDASKRVKRQPGTSKLAHAAAVASGNNRPEPIAFAAAAGSTSLSLVRSFDIPTSDSSYNRLANLSWTYDNALAVLAFTDLNYKSQAVRLLDQLKALQRADGSLAFAYDVNTGGESGQIRSNALAWVGIAAVAFRDKYNDTSYDNLIAGLAKYLLASKRASDGLLPGGPDVTWVSTQHNILGAEFFRSAGIEFGTKAIGTSSITGTQLTTQYNTTGTSIVNKLIVSPGLLSAYFVQGLNDARIPVDVQSLGSVFLQNRVDLRAAFVGGYLSNFYVGPHTVAGTAWSGYKPFLGGGAPNIVWSEGTVQADWALHRVSILSPLSDTAVAGIYATTGSGATGPKGADVASNDAAWGEFPSWPASAAGSWLLIQSGGGDALF